MPEAKKVTIKGHPNPKFNITDKIKVEYLQMSYDNRYIVVKQNTFGTMWAEITKVADPYIGKVIIEALVSNVAGSKKQKVLSEKMVKFWNDIALYNAALDLTAETEEAFS